MLRFHRISASTAAVFVAATSLAVGAGGSSAPPLLSRCHDPFVYDPKIDEIIPFDLRLGLEDAIPPLQPGDKLRHQLRPWRVFC
jgi:hypothetical protein